jgi:L,D-peptidoglycan transpeptidase YkuD (ErfK/YbiS/YcfS/YnhG family)
MFKSQPKMVSCKEISVLITESVEGPEFHAKMVDTHIGRSGLHTQLREGEGGSAEAWA